MSQLRVGSDEHKQVFCREFVETHHAYEPEDLRWPDLAPAEVERLRSLPFWGEAIGSERTAAARVRAMADVEPDPSCARPSRCRRTKRSGTRSCSRTC